MAGLNPILLALSCAAFTAAPVPQAAAQAPRERLVGSARTREGAAWSGAEVVLIARPIPWRHDLGALDRVTTRCDRDGSFAADLLPGLTYSAWAWSPLADSEVRMSALREDLAPGETPVLAELPAPRRACALQVRGLDAWRELGPASLRVVGAAANLHETRLVLDAQGNGLLPPQPGARCHVEILAAEDQVLAVAPIDLAEPRAGPVVVDLPPPATVRLLVQDHAGAGLPAASLRLGCPGYAWHGRVATPYDPHRWGFGPARHAPAKDGFVLRVPWPVDGVPRVAAEVSAPECGTRVLLLPAASAGETLSVRADPDGITVTLRLPAGAEARGVVLAGPGQPVPDLALDVSCFGRVLGGGGGPACLLPIPVRTDAAGRFVLAGLEPEAAFQVWACSADLAPVLPASSGARAPVVFLAHGGPHGNAPVDLGQVRLDQLQSLRILATARDGSPAENPRVHLGMRDLPEGPADNIHRRQWWPGDRRGQLTILMPARPVDVLAHTAGGLCGAREWEPLPAAASRAATVPLTLLPAATVTGRVLDAAGKPAPGTLLGLAALRENGLPRSWRSRQAQHELQDRWLSGVADAQGRFALRFWPMTGGRLVLRARSGAEFAGSELVLDDESMAGAELVLDTTR
jgi:hypothetical protein